MLRVGTWNIENFFQPEPGADQPIRDRFTNKVELLATTIVAEDLDIVALQEIGDEDASTTLTNALNNNGGGGTYVSRLSSNPDRRGIRVGFITRLATTGTSQDLPQLAQGLAPVQVRDVASDNSHLVSQMGRGALRIEVMSPGGNPVTLITCHLKSKLLTYPRESQGQSRFEPRDEQVRARFGGYAINLRSAEAVTLRQQATAAIASQGDSRAVIVLGDMNDAEDAQTTLVLHGPEGSQFGTGGFPRPDQGDADRLWNLSFLLPEDQRVSRIHNGIGEMLDHILVSRRLMPPTNLPALRTVSQSNLPTIGNNPNDRNAEISPDHALVIAELDI